MRISLLISGRISRYEVCLLPILKKEKYEIDLFVSVNDQFCEYYEIMKNELSPWIKGLYVKPYEFPDKFENTHLRSLRQLINGKYVPLHTMSMFFNDMNAFNMATKYADDNNFEYDAYLKYRSDIISHDLPEIKKTTEKKIFSTVPSCDFTEPLVNRETKTLGDQVPIVSDAVAYGNRETMKIYCDTYNFVLEINEDWSGNYPINFEQCVTQNIYDKEVPVQRFEYFYMLDRNRRIFDNHLSYHDIGNGTDRDEFWQRKDIPNCLPTIDIKNTKSTSHIKPSGVN